MSSPNQPSKSRAPLYFGIAVLSSLLSLYSLIASDIINNDGILYINTAEAFISGGISKAMTVFSWPFFSITIAWFHALTGVDIELSAYIVNAIYLVVLSISLLLIYEEICTPHLPLWVPALFILALPIVNDYRAYIIRGHGFWAFTALALLFFIRYSKRPSIRPALLWQIFSITAALFRIEGVIFLASAPFYFLFRTGKGNRFIQHFLRLNSITIPITIIAILVLSTYILNTDDFSYDLSHRLNYILPASMIAALTKTASEMAEIMPRLSSSESIIVVFSGLIILVLYKLIKNINLVYLAIWFIGQRKQWIRLSQESHIVLFYAFISILPLIAIAGNKFVISSRYTVLSVILFSLIPLQYIDYLLCKLINSRRLVAASILATLMVVLFLDGIIHTGSTKDNIVAAGKWTQQNITVNEKIACNDKRLCYYSDRDYGYYKNIAKNQVRKTKLTINSGEYDYILLWLGHNNNGLRKHLKANNKIALVKTFSNERQDEVRLYRIKQK